MPLLITIPTFYKVNGHFWDKRGSHQFAGEIEVKESGIFSGRDLEDIDSPNPRFDIDGFVAHWGGRLVMMFLKRYHNQPEIKFTDLALADVLYYLCHQNHGAKLEGHWGTNNTGWWILADEAPPEACALFYRVLLHFITIPEIEKHYLTEQNRGSPIIALRNKMIADERLTRKKAAIELFKID